MITASTYILAFSNLDKKSQHKLVHISEFKVNSMLNFFRIRIVCLILKKVYRRCNRGMSWQKDTQQKPPYDNECKKIFDSLFGEDKD